MTFIISHIPKYFGFACRMSLIIIYTVVDTIRVVASMAYNKSEVIFYSQAKRWARKILKVSKVELVIDLDSGIRNDSSYVFVSNHSSMFDIPVLIASLPGNVNIIYKKELEKIVIFGWGLRRSPFIAIERSDPRKAMASIDEGVRSIRDGASVIVFPEGTRSEDGQLSSFKRGAFLLAARAGKPIVPVTVIGSSQILPAGSLKFVGGSIRVIIGKPIANKDDISRLEEKVLMNSVHEIIKRNLASDGES